jgi:hypothetical protein
MKLKLILLLLVFTIGCQSENPIQEIESNKQESKTSFGKAIDSAKQVDKLNDQHNQALKEQADGL